MLPVIIIDGVEESHASDNLVLWVSDSSIAPPPLVHRVQQSSAMVNLSVFEDSSPPRYLELYQFVVLLGTNQPQPSSPSG